MPETAGLGERIDRIDVDSVERSNAAAVGEARHPTPSRVTVAFEYCIRSRRRDRNPARRLLALRWRRPRLNDPFHQARTDRNRRSRSCVFPTGLRGRHDVGDAAVLVGGATPLYAACRRHGFQFRYEKPANATASNPSLKENGHLVPELLQSRRGRNCRRVVASVRMEPASPNAALPAFAELAYLRVGRTSHHHEFRQRKR